MTQPVMAKPGKAGFLCGAAPVARPIVEASLAYRQTCPRPSAITVQLAKRPPKSRRFR